MPYELIWESPQAVLCRFFGEVVDAELDEATNALLEDSGSDLVASAIWDFSAMTGFQVSPKHASEIAATDAVASGYMPPMRHAFVSRDPAFSQLARLYIEEAKQMGSHWENRLFETLAEARAWLTQD